GRDFERSRGRLFFGDFLWAKQKKVTPAAGKSARRAGENDLKTQTQRAKPSPLQANTLAARAKIIQKSNKNQRAN
ncbi:MAG TPA: hypothetical protein DCS87_17235, partial [Rheinheimera sp.]|nr:hypothetical protein [Rheinheimera sp.]